MTSPVNRRQFVTAAASASVALGPAIRASGKEPPSRRVRIGLIGCGGRGRQLLQVMREYADVEFPIISDVIEPRMDQAARLLSEGPSGKVPERVLEHEQILERQDIDAVLITTTQHWHGLPFIQAAQAGKHIYVEKPLSHTVVEGRAMVDAANKHRVIAMMGTQQRGYPHYEKAFEILRSGRLGKIALVECWKIWEDRRMDKSVEREDNPRYWGDGKPGNEVDGPWQRLFVDCVTEGKQPPIDFEESHRATVCCHLANIAYLVGRQVDWDGTNELILGNEEASALLARPRRKGYELPKV